jgi:molybdopterin converting factor subunit 1
VRLFARLREIAGTADAARDLPAGATARDAWNDLVTAVPALAPYSPVVSCAVNEAYVKMNVALKDGDEVAFLPPVSGG